MGKFSFVAFLYLIGFAGVIEAGRTAFEQFEFWHSTIDGTMVQAFRPMPYLSALPDNALEPVNVKYLTEAGELTVSQKLLDGREIKRLIAGEKIPIRFLKDDPQRAYLDGATPKVDGVIYVFLGCFALGMYAHYLLRKDYRQSRTAKRLQSD
jgi:hypothetical protein